MFNFVLESPLLHPFKNQKHILYYSKLHRISISRHLFVARDYLWMLISKHPLFTRIHILDFTHWELDKTTSNESKIYSRASSYYLMLHIIYNRKYLLNLPYLIIFQRPQQPWHFFSVWWVMLASLVTRVIVKSTLCNQINCIYWQPNESVYTTKIDAFLYNT